jgi:hypothetical protein
MAVKIVATDASRAIVGVGCLRMRLCERVGNQAALACVLTGATACQNSDLRRHIPIPRFSIMAKMSTSDLKAMLASEKADALAALSAARLAEERADAMDYYLGDMRKDMPAQDIFAGSDEVVRFEPVGPEDEAAAQQETDYVNHVFMQQNPGFMTLYSFVKDALLSKVGVVKVWWEEREEESRETYYDLTDDQFALLAQAVTESNGAMKIIEHTAHDLAGETQTEATS